MTLKVKERREEHEEGKTRSSACSEEKSVEANRKALGVLCAAASRLSSVDASLHEVARVDGATPLQRIFYIDIPELVPVIVIQLIMSFGNLMNVGFEKAYLLQTSLNKATSEIIATYVYEQGLLKAMYSFSTAVGLFNTVVNIVLLVVVNTVCKRLSDVSFI